MSDVAARIRLARVEARHPNATKAAQAYGWTVSTYLGYENGDRAPSREAAIRIARAFRVRLDWLLTGRGEMRPGAGDQPLAAEAVEFAKAFGRAPPGVQRIIEGILKGAGSLTDDEKRSLEAPDVAYVQPEPDAPLNLQDSPPERSSGLPIDKIELDQAAMDAAVARAKARKRRRR